MINSVTELCRRYSIQMPSYSTTLWLFTMPSITTLKSPQCCRVSNIKYLIENLTFKLYSEDQF